MPLLLLIGAALALLGVAGHLSSASSSLDLTTPDEGGTVNFSDAQLLEGSLLTGLPLMDREEVQAPLLARARLEGFTLREARAWTAILVHESAGNPANFLGDVDAPGGPSIGIGQVERVTAKAMGLWSWDGNGDERSSYAALAKTLPLPDMLRWSAAVFGQELYRAGGDLRLAVYHYNGSGDAAARYRDAISALVQKHWGETL